MPNFARLLLLAVAAVVLRPESAAAQCPDGSPRTAGGCRGRSQIDTNAFLVLPFVVRGAPEAAYLGRSMVDLLHMALNGVGRIRIEYAAGLLDELSSGSSGDPRAVVGSALELGIGRIISGTIVVVGPDIRIGAQIFDVARNRPQFEVSGRAKLDNVGVVMDSIAAQILARRAVASSERNRVNIGEYATRSPQALQAYLVARQHVRSRERHAGADSLKSALRHDPNFGLAYLLLRRLESAQGGVTGIPGDTIDIMARARIAHFPERVRNMFSEARNGDRFQRRAWATGLISGYPDDPDAAFHFADRLFHSGINLGETHEAAIQAFQRAYALDDQDPELVEHYATLLAEVGDSAGLRALRRSQCRSRRVVQCEMGVHYRAIYGGEDPLTMDISDDSLVGTDLANYPVRSAAFDPALGLALSDSFAQRQLRGQHPPNRRSAIHLVRSAVALARGQHALAGARLDSASNLTPRPGFILLHNIVTGTRGDEAASIAGRGVGRGSVMAVARAWWAAATQPATVAEAYLPDIDQPRDPIGTRGFTTGLQGLIALRAGDTVKALELFEAMRPYRINPTIPARLLFPGAYLILTHARLEAARGNHARARTYLADVYPINEYVPFIGDAEELRAEVALALADTASARVHLKNVIAVWKDADAPIQPRVARARALLARLPEARGPSPQ